MKLGYLWIILHAFITIVSSLFNQKKEKTNGKLSFIIYVIYNKFTLPDSLLKERIVIDHGLGMRIKPVIYLTHV
jgi:hypothetical protein